MQRLVIFVLSLVSSLAIAQPVPNDFPFGPQNLSILNARQTQWTPDGNGVYLKNNGQIEVQDLKTSAKTILVSKEQLTPQGQKPLAVQAFEVHEKSRKVLVYNNSKRVWRYATKGDYWVLNLADNSLKQIGKSRPASSLMFAKLSPDGLKVAYVSEQNLYVENLADGSVKALTTDGGNKLIHGTFDWVYEEELDCRDGFRWSPDGSTIAFWTVDARKVRNFLMMNNTDSTYSYTVPVEYPKAGERFSPAYVKTVNIATGNIKTIAIPGEPDNNLLPRMEWLPTGNELLVQQLDRRQQVSKLFLVNSTTGDFKNIHTETDANAWVDVRSAWLDEDMTNWHWLANGKEFLYLSEKGGWRQLYKITRDGKETLLHKEAFDIVKIYRIDEKNGFAYFAASPQNATQLYLYRLKLDGKSKAERITPGAFSGTNDYEISPNGSIAKFSFSAANQLPTEATIALPQHNSFADGKPLETPKVNPKRKIEFFQVKTSEGVTIDGWMVKPTNFDSTKKYPIVFYVYGEPAATTVNDRAGTGNNFLYQGSMADKGYIYASLDSRGTPAPKGATWRKAIYRNNGTINTRDHALATQEILKKNPFIDPDRVAIWGWSGGGMSTLNALMQYPDTYKTGIAVAAISNLLLYDNIYEERYMGVPQESRADYLKGSPISHVQNLKGNLLYIHGTGDDNVHYQNAEVLINELVKAGKLFSLMIYPNRSHGISEGAGTFQHLSKTYTDYLNKNCPGGGK